MGQLVPLRVGKARGVYSGPGRFRKGNAEKFAGRDNLLTGGWAAGEMALKLKDQLTLKKGDYVAGLYKLNAVRPT
jgi:hypothetical protein